MGSKSRFFESLPDSVSLKAAFGGDRETHRMNTVRASIQKIREAWGTNEGYRNLMRNVEKYFQLYNFPPDAREPLLRLLEGFRDYGDLRFGRPQEPPMEHFNAVELYCSKPGFECLYSLMGKVIRLEGVGPDDVAVATSMLELVTIDLYNIRLSQISHPRYANFEGITFRGLRVTDAESTKRS
ncbi:hypothetical protein ACHAQJ_002208 [Trichoderma viride]